MSSQDMMSQENSQCSQQAFTPAFCTPESQGVAAESMACPDVPSGVKRPRVCPPEPRKFRFVKSGYNWKQFSHNPKTPKSGSSTPRSHTSPTTPSSSDSKLSHMSTCSPLNDKINHFDTESPPQFSMNVASPPQILGTGKVNPHMSRSMRERHSLLRQSYPKRVTAVQSVASRYFDEFEQLKEVGIGAGSMSKVFKCLHRVDGWIYAVKRIRIKHSINRERKMLSREPQAMAALGFSAHVVRYQTSWFEEIERDAYMFIQMEFCEDTLSSMYTGRVVDESSVLRIMHGIATGLRDMHKIHIVHLDIKPENIYLGRDHLWKIGDFGLALSHNGMMRPEMEGDCRYLSREALDITDTVDLTKADIFAFGISMYQLLTGATLPKDGPEYHSLRSGAVKFPSEVSIALCDLIHKMMCPSPEGRPTAAQILQDELLSGCWLKPTTTFSSQNTPNDEVGAIPHNTPIAALPSPTAGPSPTMTTTTTTNGAWATASSSEARLLDFGGGGTGGDMDEDEMSFTQPL